MLFSTRQLRIVDSQADADHYTKGRTGIISTIVLHATAGTNSLGWLTTDSPPGREVSIHRLIRKDGVIHKIVPDADTAWHAGPSQRWNAMGDYAQNMNAVSLGIELENLNTISDKYPTAQLRSCGEQLVEWFGLYGFLPVVFHYQIQANKKDPRYLSRATLDGFILEALRAAI